MKFTYDESTDWDLIANQSEEIEGLSGYEKLRVKEAFRFLKEEFGTDFLRINFNEHPFFRNIYNYVPYTRLWFADFAENLSQIKHYLNYYSLLKRLKDCKKFVEAETVLETAIKFLKNGFDIEFDPHIIVNSKPKIPDLKLIDQITKQPLYCEVSISHISEIQTRAEQTEWELFNAIRNSYLHLEIAGSIHKSLPLTRMKELVTQITQLSKLVIDKEGFGELIIDSTLQHNCIFMHEVKIKIIDIGFV